MHKKLQLAAIAVFCAFCAVAAPAAAQMFRPHEPLNPAKAQSLELVPLTIVSGDKRHEFMVEVADSSSERTTGLMHRTELKPNQGMLFDFKDTQPIRIWMRNTFIPLDLLFMKRDGTVAFVYEHMIPHDERAVGPREEMYSVLELPDGTIAKLGLKAGDKLEHAIFKSK